MAEEEAEQEVMQRTGSAEEEGETNTDNAGSTPLPSTERTEPEENKPGEDTQDEPADAMPEPLTEQPPPEVNPTDVPPQPEDPSSQPLPPPGTTVEKSYSYGFRSGGDNLPLTINHMAISASAQNKLPVNRVKGIVLRVGRHTESSSQKRSGWYRGPSYVDKDSYNWKNMPLFDDYQRHLWTPEGTVRSSCKK